MPEGALDLAALALLVVGASALFSAGGQAGASAYIAAMALFGVPPPAMKSTALFMNVVVAATGSARFASAGGLRWDLLLPLAAGSIPAAFLGGMLTLSSRVHLAALGALLTLAALRLWLPIPDAERPRPPTASLVGSGAAIGLASGLSGIGGGVLLTPLLLIGGWGRPRETAGVSIVFILLNSLTALAGHFAVASSLPWQAAPLAAAALGGAFAGSWAGVKRLDQASMRKVQATILLATGLKLVTDALRAAA